MRSRVGIYGLAGAAFALAVLLSILGVGEEEGALTNWQALVLGVVQGATELLPISSSGHLILVPWLADWQVLQEDDEFNQTFDVALHLGTLVAVVGYFWRDVVRLLSAWVGSLSHRSIRSTDERVAWAVFVATIPAAVVGALGEEFIVDRLGEPWQIAILLAFFALILLVADRTPQRRDLETVGVKEGFAIGVAQGLALMPGVSRSGITISAARFLGFDRDSAARLSFLLLIPTTFGAVLWKGVTDVLLADLPAGWQGPFVVGILAALASGLLAIVFLLGFVRRHTYAPFVVYRVVVAALVLLVIASGAREAVLGGLANRSLPGCDARSQARTRERPYREIRARRGRRPGGERVATQPDCANPLGREQPDRGRLERGVAVAPGRRSRRSADAAVISATTGPTWTRTRFPIGATDVIVAVRWLRRESSCTPGPTETSQG